MLPNATLLEEVFAVLLIVASVLTFTAARRAWRRIWAVSDRAAQRAAIDWFRVRALLAALIWLTLWGTVLALFAPEPLAPIHGSALLRRIFGIGWCVALIGDAVWTWWSDHQFALEFDARDDA